MKYLVTVSCREAYFTATFYTEANSPTEAQANVEAQLENLRVQRQLGPMSFSWYVLYVSAVIEVELTSSELPRVQSPKLPIIREQ